MGSEHGVSFKAMAMFIIFIWIHIYIYVYICTYILCMYTLMDNDSNDDELRSIKLGIG